MRGSYARRVFEGGVARGAPLHLVLTRHVQQARVAGSYTHLSLPAGRALYQDTARRSQGTRRESFPPRPSSRGTHTSVPPAAHAPPTPASPSSTNARNCEACSSTAVHNREMSRALASTLRATAGRTSPIRPVASTAPNGASPFLSPFARASLPSNPRRRAERDQPQMQPPRPGT